MNTQEYCPAPKTSEWKSRLRDAIDAKTTLMPIRAQIKLTKSDMGYSEALLLRDHALEARVFTRLEEGPGWHVTLERYRQYDPSISTVAPPRHIPVHLLAGQGALVSGKNIFYFQPGHSEEDTVGFEFIDVWHAVFRDCVFPCAARFLTVESQMRVFTPLLPVLLDTVYLAAIFHEVGHRVGFFAVSPNLRPNNLLSSFYVDVLGELATDSLLVHLLPEYRELGLFVLLQRLFWFGRQGFRMDPESGSINTDNDAWLGSCLWTAALRFGVLSPANEARRWQLNVERVPYLFQYLTEQLDSLGRQLAQLDTSAAQDQLAADWMAQYVPTDAQTGRFLLPDTFQQLLAELANIPEIPHFNPMIAAPVATLVK